MEKISKEKWSINDLVYLTADNRRTVENILYKLAFELEGGINYLYTECGWQGGTIHQIIDKIMELKKETTKNDTL